MKKKLLSLVLTLAMVVSLFAGMTVTASAEGAEEPAVAKWVTVAAGAEEPTEGWSDLVTLTAAFDAANGAEEAKMVYVKLVDNVTVDGTSFTLNAEKSMVLDLGQNTIKAEGTTGKSPITVKGNLTVKNGSIVSNSTQYGCKSIDVQSGAALTVTGCEISASNTTEAGAYGIYANGATVTVSGGKITVSSAGSVNGLMGANSTVTVQDCTIETTSTGSASYAIQASVSTTLTVENSTLNAVSESDDARKKACGISNNTTAPVVIKGNTVISGGSADIFLVASAATINAANYTGTDTILIGYQDGRVKAGDVVVSNVTVDNKGKFRLIDSQGESMYLELDDGALKLADGPQGNEPSEPGFTLSLVLEVAAELGIYYDQSYEYKFLKVTDFAGDVTYKWYKCDANGENETLYQEIRTAVADDKGNLVTPFTPSELTVGDHYFFAEVTDSTGTKKSQVIIIHAYDYVDLLAADAVEIECTGENAFRMTTNIEGAKWAALGASLETLDGNELEDINTVEFFTTTGKFYKTMDIVDDVYGVVEVGNDGSFAMEEGMDIVMLAQLDENGGLVAVRFFVLPEAPAEELYEITLNASGLKNGAAFLLFYSGDTFTGEVDRELYVSAESTEAISLDTNTYKAVVAVGGADDGLAFKELVVTVNGGAPIEGTFDNLLGHVFDIGGFTGDSVITIVGEATPYEFESADVTLVETFSAIVNGEALPNLDEAITSAWITLKGGSKAFPHEYYPATVKWLCALKDSGANPSEVTHEVADTDMYDYFIQITLPTIGYEYLVDEGVTGNSIHIVDEEGSAYTLKKFEFMYFEESEKPGGVIAVVGPVPDPVELANIDCLIDYETTFAALAALQPGQAMPTLNGAITADLKDNSGPIVGEPIDTEVSAKWMIMTGLGEGNYRFDSLQEEGIFESLTQNQMYVLKITLTGNYTVGNAPVVNVVEKDALAGCVMAPAKTELGNGVSVLYVGCFYTGEEEPPVDPVTPPTPPAPSRPSGSTPTVDVPMSNNENKVDVKAEVSGKDATIKPLNEKQIEQLVGDENASGDVVVDLSNLGKTIDTAGIPKKTLETIVDAAEDAGNDTEHLVIKLSTAELKLDDAAMRAIVDQADGDIIKFNFDDVGLGRLNKEQKEAVKDMDVRKGYEAYITVNGQRIGDFKGGEVEIIVPYAVPAGENVAGFSVWYIDENGKPEKQKSTYDGKEKCFVVTHFSDYVIVYNEDDAQAGSYMVCTKDETCPIHPYTDASTTEWYHDGVHYCIDNGLMSGYGNGIFKPNADTTRAMITVMLWRLNGSPVVDYQLDFEDVAEGQWYTEAIRWAKSEGVVTGYGNGFFGTNDAVTREQMATILYRYCKYKGIDVSVGEDTNILSYEGAFDISNWAMEAMQWACGSGMIEGIAKDGTMYLDPQGNAIRCQSATMIYRFCEELKK